MAEESAPTTHRDAVERVREAQSFTVTLPVVGRVRVPRPEQLAFYGALGALAAVEIIEWPVALVLGVGHALMQNEHSRVAQEVGEALEEA
jgi:xanthosine utilization system XapX-like protein